ncbi:MAG: glutamine--tRNA ligase/YqeY domain fusion protein [Planctomycetes bacterium]|nr:glutamine--tRNA ligase/YqeY domain fusion protein [Planctomycetota bacterium]
MSDNVRQAAPERNMHFIRQAIADDVAAGRNGGRVHTRFPPEPNGPMHLGHAKGIWINFSMAQEFGGLFNLRMDDTNPTREEPHYVQAIIEDIRWLGCDWGDRLFYASDYFDRMHEYAVQLIRQGDAYVCDLSAEQLRETRGTPTSPGTNSPYRERGVDENLDLFQRMTAGEFPDGARTLRAKIDMAHPNLNMRDPVMYRILHATHYRQGDRWCVYPTYDWAHGIEDSIEGITHSLCSIEFENHRPLYDWYLDRIGCHHPRQIEFARLEMPNTLMSTRKLRELVEEGRVAGWDDPRLPTLSAVRRKGYTPEAIRDFIQRAGVSKTESVVDTALLEHCAREDLNRRAPRVMGVLKPLKVVITNYPEGEGEQLEAINNPEDKSAGTRIVPFSRELYIERDDFMEEPPRKFYRLTLGREVRLRYAYFITCTEVIKGEDGEVVELRCTYDPATRGGDAPDGRKVKSTLHWVSAQHALSAEVRLYGPLLLDEPSSEAEEDGDWKSGLNPDSLETLTGCMVEPSLKGAEAGYRCQFERLGYFCVDPDSTDDLLVFNQTVTLRDRWARIQKARRKGEAK